MIVNQKGIQPVTAALGGQGYDGQEMLCFLKGEVKRLYIVDGEEICRQAGSAKALNVVLLGVAAASGALGIEREEMEDEIKRRVRPQYQEMNLKALKLGAALV